MNNKEISSYIKEDVVENDSIAVKWNWKKFINEWIIRKDTKLKIWELLNIGWVNFPIKDIFFAMPGLHYVDTEHWRYSIEIADKNNWEQFKYYEKTRNN